MKNRHRVIYGMVALLILLVFGAMGCGKKQEQYYERGLKGLEASKQLSAMNDLRLIANAISRYYMEHNELPQGTIEDVMKALVPSYLRNPITHVLGQRIVYTLTGNSFELRVPGPDKKLNTADDIVVTGP